MLEIESKFPELQNLSQQSDIKKKEINKQIIIIMQQNNIGNTGDGSTVNTGSHNQINSAKGKDISQNTLPIEKKDEVQDFIDRVQKILQEEQDFECKEDISLEVQRIKNQLSKPEPQQTIINQSLEVIKSFVISITANAWTPQILSSINSLLGS